MKRLYHPAGIFRDRAGRRFDAIPPPGNFDWHSFHVIEALMNSQDWRFTGRRDDEAIPVPDAGSLGGRHTVLIIL